MKKFKVGDKVRITSKCAYEGVVGEVLEIKNKKLKVKMTYGNYWFSEKSVENILTSKDYNFEKFDKVKIVKKSVQHDLGLSQSKMVGKIGIITSLNDFDANVRIGNLNFKFNLKT